MRLKHYLLCILAVSSLSACLRDEDPPGTDPGTNPGTEPGAEAVATYTLGEPTNYETKLEGLSAICMNEAGNGLLVAEDNGHIYEFGLDGTLRSTFEVPNPDGRTKVDLEGIALSPDGKLYVCEERYREVYLLGADHKSITLLSTGPKEEGAQDNQGYEGIAAGKDVLYVANQSAPKRVYTYSLKTGEWATAFNADWATSLSDLYCDKDDGTLWITDAKTQKLTQLKADGTVLNTYNISFVDKPEGFCMDKANKRFWFVCDKTSRLISVSYQLNK